MTLRVLIHEDKEAGGLWASVVEMPGCYAAGKTEEELFEALEEAIRLYIEDVGLEEVAEPVKLREFTLDQERLVPA